MPQCHEQWAWQLICRSRHWTKMTSFGKPVHVEMAEIMSSRSPSLIEAARGFRSERTSQAELIRGAFPPFKNHI